MRVCLVVAEVVSRRIHVGWLWYTSHTLELEPHATVVVWVQFMFAVHGPDTKPNTSFSFAGGPVIGLQ